MKKINIFATKLGMFITILPIAFLLVVSIINNPSVETPGKLYPLIIGCIFGIAMITVYLWRSVRITLEEVRSIGPFSSKDRVILKKDRTLSLTLRPKNKLRIEVYGRDDAPGYDWLKADENEYADVNLYRDTAIGGQNAVKRVLWLCGIEGDEAKNILEAKEYDGRVGDFEIRKYVVDSSLRYDIKFLETL